MHTEMRSSFLDSSYVERCRTAWWTIYVLERQMSSLMGVPIGIAEECISTPFPKLSGQPQRLAALQIQVKLSRVLAKIDQSKILLGRWDYENMFTCASCIWD